MKTITKAVFPVAGLGTRFLPATKAIPKEMLPIIDKPLIEYAVEEAVNAGITEIIFITSHTKRAIEDHFDQNFELEEKLLKSGKKDFVEKINRDIFKYLKMLLERIYLPTTARFDGALVFGFSIISFKRNVLFVEVDLSIEITPYFSVSFSGTSLTPITEH